MRRQQVPREEKRTFFFGRKEEVGEKRGKSKRRGADGEKHEFILPYSSSASVLTPGLLKPIIDRGK